MAQGGKGVGVGGRWVTSLGGGHILLGGNIPGFPDKPCMV